MSSEGAVAPGWRAKTFRDWLVTVQISDDPDDFAYTFDPSLFQLLPLLVYGERSTPLV